jgi:hypothetical protein
VYNRNHTNNTKQNIICHQTCPSTTIWTPWRKILCHFTLPNGRKLRQPLGKWTVPPNEIQKEYHSYCNKKYVYQRHKERYTAQRLDNKHRVAGSKSFTRNKSSTALLHAVTEISQHTTEVYATTVIVTAVTDSSVIGDKGTWSVIFVNAKGKALCQR